MERWPREDGSALRSHGGSQDVDRAEAPSLQRTVGAMCGVMQSDRARIGSASPPPSSRRYFMGRRGDASCPLCARWARSGAAIHAEAWCHSLAATWVVLTVGEPS